FWVLPFYLRRAYLNDMGWEKLTDYGVNLVPQDYRWLFVFPVVGAVFAFLRRSRTGIWMVVMVAVFAVAFVLAPQGRLWNARLLPFYFLCLYLLGGYAIAEAGKSLARAVGRANAHRMAPAIGADTATVTPTVTPTGADAAEGVVADAAAPPEVVASEEAPVDVGAPRPLDPAERAVRLLTPIVGLAFVLVLVALPLHALPFGRT